MSKGLSDGCTCAHVDGFRIKSRSCPAHGPTMPPARPAHEDPLRRTFTREQLDEAMAAARQAGRDAVVARVEALADESCHHCGKTAEEDGDHTCRCPLSDGVCFDHLAYPVVSLTLLRALVAEFRAPDATSEPRP